MSNIGGTPRVAGGRARWTSGLDTQRSRPAGQDRQPFVRKRKRTKQESHPDEILPQQSRARVLIAAKVTEWGLVVCPSGSNCLHTSKVSRLILNAAANVSDALPSADLHAALPRLRRYARVLTGDLHRADDLVQDTLARAWDKRNLWRAGSDLRAWLFTIMHNVYVNQCALALREARNVSLDCEGEYSAAWQVAAYGNQLDRIELRELMQQVGRLPAEQREVLLLAAVEELRYEEIAVALSIPIGTVMSRLSRAREKMRRIAAEPRLAITRDGGFRDGRRRLISADGDR